MFLAYSKNVNSSFIYSLRCQLEFGAGGGGFYTDGAASASDGGTTAAGHTYFMSRLLRFFLFMCAH